MKRVLIACEESQRVTIEFRKLGIKAYSCDLEPCSGGHPEWHIQEDVIPLLDAGWDMIIAFPPCTYMSKAGARWMYPQAGILNEERYQKALAAKEFFMKFLNADVKYIAIENPTPLKVVGLPKPTQIIQPYQFGHNYSKRTLLWLKNLPPLQPTDIVENFKPYLPSNTGGVNRNQKFSRGVAHNAKDASKTFRGIAEGMATQWGRLLLEN